MNSRSENAAAGASPAGSTLKQPSWLALIGGLLQHEWRRARLSPVWMAGLAGAILLAISESGASAVLGYPSRNESVYAFQLASSMLLGLVAFLLAAGSLAADLDGARKALIFSRPAPPFSYLAGKFTGAASFSLAVAAPLLLLCLGAPLWHGVLRLHPPGQFLLVLLLCTLPLVSFASALAIFFGSIFRKVILTFPLFLVYFFVAALLGVGHQPTTIIFTDFSQRLYPRELIVQMPLHLREYTFSGLLDPVSPALVARAGLYSISFIAPVACGRGGLASQAR